jgi:DNA-binding FadR family transcriptional regulator
MTVHAQSQDPVAEVASRPKPDVAPSHGLQAQILERLGLALTSGELKSGSVVRIEELEERYGVSRSVIRETLQVLASMGMLVSRRRIGVQILPFAEWNLFDPRLIRWRLASSERIAQLRSLTELRTAIEPEAARLAATRAPLSSASELMGLAGKLWAAGQAGDSEGFLEIDVHFHRLVLISSGNEMFGKLDSLVAEGITGRTHYGLMPQHPPADALQLHVDIANAIQRKNPDHAHDAMLRIMQRTLDEMSSIWDAQILE